MDPRPLTSAEQEKLGAYVVRLAELLHCEVRLMPQMPFEFELGCHIRWVLDAYPRCVVVKSDGGTCGRPIAEGRFVEVEYRMCSYHLGHLRRDVAAKIEAETTKKALDAFNLTKEFEWDRRKRELIRELDCEYREQHAFDWQHQRDRERRDGRVYFVRSNETGNIKIGKTITLQRRMRALERDFGSLELLLELRGYTDAERKAHNRFSDLHVGREWFRPEPSLLSFISRALELKGHAAGHRVAYPASP